MSSEVNEMYDGIGAVILDTRVLQELRKNLRFFELENYKMQESYTDSEWYRREEAIKALESLLEKLNEQIKDKIDKKFLLWPVWR